MNIEDQIVQAFDYEVVHNHHHLISKDLLNRASMESLRLVFDQVSKAEERPYINGQIEFNPPQKAFSMMVRKQPITYMDKLLILASFARCLQFSYELTGVEVKRRLVTFLRVTKMNNPNESYIMCPGVPFNKTPFYVLN